MRGPIGNNFSRAQVPSQLAPRSVLVCTRQAVSRLPSSAGPLRRGAQLGAIGPIGLRPALIAPKPVSLTFRDGQVKILVVIVSGKDSVLEPHFDITTKLHVV